MGFMIMLMTETADKKPIENAPKKTRKSKYDDLKKAALPLLLKGHKVAEIQEFLNLPNPRIIYNWIKAEKWDDLMAESFDAEFTASQRLVLLINKDKKTNAEINEMEKISLVLINLAKAKAVSSGQSIHGNPKQGGSKGGKSSGKGKKKKNDIEHLTQADFDRVAAQLLYPHQLKWREAGKDPRTRNDRLILKSRQIGATFFFAFEAFESACIEGQNQIFLSATREQAEIFKAYMYAIASEYFDVELTGNPTKLSNNAMCYYLSSNSAGAQSRAGNVYFDEMFWCRDWEKMFDLGAAMATQGYKITGFSTPSALSHPAIKNWNGKRYNQERPKSEQVKINLNRSDLKKGTLGGDGVWRNLVSMQDAIDQGFDRVDVEVIKRRNPPSVYKNLYECHFVNDKNSVFNLNDILACAVDVESWRKSCGFKVEADKPYGNKPCAAGLDPAGDGDNASATLMSLPQSLKDKFRMFESTMLDGLGAPEQGEHINEWNEKYNIEYCGVNTNGIGYFVPDFIDPEIEVERLEYQPRQKAEMITKAKTIFAKKRFEYPDTNKALPLAFLTIVQTTTPGTRQITYKSTRSDEVGHGDEAWSAMHCFMGERLDIGYEQTSSLSISGG